MTDVPLVLGIETSCDETGVGIVELGSDGSMTILADQVHGADVVHVTSQLLEAPRTTTGAVGAKDWIVRVAVPSCVTPYIARRTISAASSAGVEAPASAASAR